MILEVLTKQHLDKYCDIKWIYRLFLQDIDHERIFCWDKYITLSIAQRIWMVRFMLYLSWQDLDLFVFISLFLRNSVFLFISKKDSKSYSNSLKKTMICPYGIRKAIFIYVIEFFKRLSLLVWIQRPNTTYIITTKGQIYFDAGDLILYAKKVYYN